MEQKFVIKTENEYQVQITEEKQGNVTLYHFAFTFAQKVSPKPLHIVWEECDGGYYARYTPCFLENNYLRPYWAHDKIESAVCFNMPFFALLGKAGECRYTLSLSDVVLPTEIKMGFIEESNYVRAKVTLFAKPCSPMDGYQVTLRIDKQVSNIYDGGQRAVAWWKTLGYHNDNVPDAAFAPVYSTWYNFHQKLDPETLLEECRIAASLGMKTLIIDDGWQTDDNSRGYAYCGDWEVTKNKFPDFAGFVKQIHALGMKVVLWYSVPFVGDYTQAYARFKGKYLASWDHINVLDPRYREVRDYLAQTYAKALTEFGIDGFKLDFIASFKVDGAFTHSPEMDCYGVEDGVIKLLDEIRTTLQKINPDVLIEFRQHYYGPVIGTYANMLRVADCPADTLANLGESVKMRALTSNVAIHSDMFTCHANEAPDMMLQQVIAALFSVPQFSFTLKNLSDKHLQALKFYIDFQTKHRNLLLKSKLQIEGADKGVTQVTAVSENERVSAQYAQTVTDICADTHHVINGSGLDKLVVRTDGGAYFYVIYDCFGNVYQRDKITPNQTRTLPIKNAYIATFTRS